MLLVLLFLYYFNFHLFSLKTRALRLPDIYGVFFGNLTYLLCAGIYSLFFLLNHVFSQICNAVALAGLLNAILVIPNFEFHNVWRDPR